MIFENQPEAKLEYREKLIALRKTSKKYELADKLYYISSKLVEKYFEKHIESASDKSIHDMLIHNASIMTHLKDRPEHCVAYHLGEVASHLEESVDRLVSIGKDNFNKEINIIIVILESSIINPSPMDKLLYADEVANILLEAIVDNEIDLYYILKLDQVDKLPAEEGCQLATNFVVAIPSLGETKSSHLFKSMFLSQK